MNKDQKCKIKGSVYSFDDYSRMCLNKINLMELSLILIIKKEVLF